MRQFLLIILVVFFVAVKATAFKFVTSHGSGLGQTAVLSNSSASVLLLIPSGGINNGQGKVELGITRRFELKDLDQGYLAAAFRLGSLTYSGGFTQFGYGDLYAERTARLAVAYQIDSLTIGVNGSLMQIDFGGHYENLTGSALGLGLSYRSGRILSALVAENINSPRLEDHSEQIRPKLTLYTELIGPGSYSVTGKVTVQDREKPGFGVGQKIDLSSIATVFWGLSTSPIIYGGGLELIHKNSLITYATSYHPTLGFTHTLSVSVTFGKAGQSADGESQKRGH